MPLELDISISKIGAIIRQSYIDGGCWSTRLWTPLDYPQISYQATR